MTQPFRLCIARKLNKSNTQTSTVFPASLIQLAVDNIKTGVSSLLNARNAIARYSLFLV